MATRHIPVMLNEVIEFIGKISDSVVADLTFGEGGHTDAFLDKGAAQVLGVDRDRETLSAYLSHGKYRDDGRLRLIHSTFSEFAQSDSPELFDAILLDLGVSTQQLLTPERGFSFKGDNELDMRMDRSETEPNAISSLQRAPLSKIIECLEIADVKKPHKVAREIKARVMAGDLVTTADLAALAGGGNSLRHPATRLFMGIRILVNREFEQISQAIPKLIERLKPGGRLMVITFHSAEDRLVKRIFTGLSGKCNCSEAVCQCSKVQRVIPLTPKPLSPSREEQRINPRSRSAKLRAVMRATPADGANG